jgi:hypothetical protein
MGNDRSIPRPTWSVVALLVALAALAATVLVMRAAPHSGNGAFNPLATGVGVVHVVDRVKLDVGQNATLFRNKDFRVVAQCIDEGGGSYTAAYGVRTLKDNALVFSTDDGNETDTRLDKADGLYRWSSYEASDTSSRYYGYDYYQEFIGESPSGNVLIGRVSSGVHMRKADCIYNGLFIT